MLAITVFTTDYTVTSSWLLYELSSGINFWNDSCSVVNRSCYAKVGRCGNFDELCLICGFVLRVIPISKVSSVLRKASA